jgi:hypothetical protein
VKARSRKDVEERLAQTANIRLRSSDSAWLVAVEDASAFLRACREADVRVVGIEGFRIDDEGRHPLLSVIADFSDVTNVGESISESESFIEEVPSETFLEFALDVPSEHARD